METGGGPGQPRRIATLFVVLGLSLIQAEVPERWVEETIFRLEEMTGQERRETILKACELKDKRLSGVLSRVLLASHKEDTEDLRDRMADSLCATADPTIAETLKKVSAAEDPDNRMRGLKVLGHVRTPDAVEFIRQRVGATFGAEKAAAITALGYSGDKGLISWVKGFIQDDAVEIQAAARMSLARLGVVEVVPDLLLDYERTVQARLNLDGEMRVAIRLAEGREKARKINRIAEKQKDLNRAIAGQRRFFLDIPAGAIPEFVKAANEKDLSYALSLVLENLPRMANRETAGRFTDLLHNRHELIRMRALDLLERHAGADLVARVQEILQAQVESDDWRIRRFAVGNCGWLAEEKRPAVVLRGLADSSRGVRLAAIEQAGAGRVAAAAARLKELSATDDVDIALACRRSLKAIEPR